MTGLVLVSALCNRMLGIGGLCRLVANAILSNILPEERPTILQGSSKLRIAVILCSEKSTVTPLTRVSGKGTQSC